MSFQEGRCVYVTPKDALADIAYADWHNKFTPLGLKVGFLIYVILESVLILLFSFFFVLVSIYHCIFFILVIFIFVAIFLDIMPQNWSKLILRIMSGIVLLFYSIQLNTELLIIYVV